MFEHVMGGEAEPAAGSDRVRRLLAGFLVRAIAQDATGGEKGVESEWEGLGGRAREGATASLACPPGSGAAAQCCEPEIEARGTCGGDGRKGGQ